MTRSEGTAARTVGRTIKDPPLYEVGMRNDCSRVITVSVSRLPV